MAWYRTGTVTVTNSSTAVIGAGTAWVDAVSTGETFVGPDGQIYEVVAINSATSLTISPAYKGSTAAGQGYAIMPSQSYMRDLAIAAAALVEGYSTVKNNAGAGKFATGTSANPSLRNAADENTGLNLLGSDMLALVTAGVERLKLDASGVPSGTTATHLMNRDNHTGTQAIATIDGLQSALNAKETPAGALAQMQGFGLGTQSMAATEDSMDAYGTGGTKLFSATQSAAVGLPLAVVHSVVYVPGGSSNGKQYAWPITSVAGNRDRVWHRQKMSGAWTAWKELASTESPVFTGTTSVDNLWVRNIASSNTQTLDHYEEGTFTPTLEGATAPGSATYSYQGGSYTRIGNRVFWTARVTLSSFTGATGAIQLRGLPFVVAGSSQDAGAVTVGFTSNLAAATNIVDVSAIHNTNAASVTLYKFISGNQGHSSMGLADLTSTTYFHLQGVYKAA